MLRSEKENIYIYIYIYILSLYIYDHCTRIYVLYGTEHCGMLRSEKENVFPFEKGYHIYYCTNVIYGENYIMLHITCASIHLFAIKYV